MTTKTLAAAMLAAAIAAPAAAQTTLDTLGCFKVNDATPRTRFQATVNAEDGTAQSCVFKTPARMACVVATATDVTPPPVTGPAGGAASGRYLCYQARCQSRILGNEEMRDALGSRTVAFRAARFVCIPAEGTPASTTTTVPGAGTTTTTVQTAGCRFANGKCTGSCGPGGGTCGAAAGTGSCECRQVACGDADSPTCDGACSDPGQACVFLISGCSCVSIP